MGSNARNAHKAHLSSATTALQLWGLKVLMCRTEAPDVPQLAVIQDLQSSERSTVGSLLRYALGALCAFEPTLIRNRAKGNISLRLRALSRGSPSLVL